MIQDKAMLASLSITQWTARRVDKKVTNEVHKAHSAKSNTGRYNKCLIDPDAKSFVAIQKIAGVARDLHYTLTLPWAQNGARILPTPAYFDYIRHMGELKRDFTTAVDDFVADYPRLIEQARGDLNGMFNAGEYPSHRDIERRFRFDTEFMPVPSENDFRVNISIEHMQQIQADVKASVERATADAMKDLWERLYKPVSHMAATLAKDKAPIFDTLVGNVQEICDLLPKLNLTGDPELNRMRNEVVASLTGVRTDDLRKLPYARNEVAKKADEIARRMASLMQ